MLQVRQYAVRDRVPPLASTLVLHARGEVVQCFSGCTHVLIPNWLPFEGVSAVIACGLSLGALCHLTDLLRVGVHLDVLCASFTRARPGFVRFW